MACQVDRPRWTTLRMQGDASQSQGVAVRSAHKRHTGSPSFQNMKCARETKILVEQHASAPQGVFVCDHAGRVINKSTPVWHHSSHSVRLDPGLCRVATATNPHSSSKQSISRSRICLVTILRSTICSNCEGWWGQSHDPRQEFSPEVTWLIFGTKLPRRAHD